MTKPSQKKRLDLLLVERGLCNSRSEAQGLILAGQVLVADHMIDKPGHLTAETLEIHLKSRPTYVSRGGRKLEKALRTFQVDVEQRICLDVGASTGGFTDCLLQHGAARVYAVDVGYGQLAWSLRNDPRVAVLERQHIAALPPESLSPPPSLAVVDVSFISLKKVLPHVLPCLSPRAASEALQLIALIKPQFEYLDYCSLSGFKGVVHQQADIETILTGLCADLARLLPTCVISAPVESPLQGPKGNREFFILLHQPI